jgi:hypothetical protein
VSVLALAKLMGRYPRCPFKMARTALWPGKALQVATDRQIPHCCMCGMQEHALGRHTATGDAVTQQMCWR